MDDIQVIIASLSVGGIYALVALGFTIIYSASNVMNFAQGEFAMLGALVGVTAVSTLQLPYLLALPVTLLVVAAIGMTLGNFIVLPLMRRAVPLDFVIATLIAVSLFLRHGSALLWGKEERYAAPPLGDEFLTLGGLNFDPQSFLVIGATAIALLATWYFYRGTVTGRSFQAAAINREAASLMGIDPDRALVVAIGVSAALGGLAGLLYSPLTNASPYMGVDLGLRGIAAAIIGGLGSPAGAVAAGFLVAFLELIASTYIAAEYRDAITFLFMLLVLGVRPSGLFSGLQTRGARVG
jgi:branched-chain amino acid transport system permease protein